MKKILSVLMAAALCTSVLAGCSGNDNSSSVGENGNIQIDTLNVHFVPSREPEEIITATEPLKEMLTTELAKEGYDPKYGARPLRRAIQSQVEDAVAEKMLDGTLREGDTAKLTVEDSKLCVSK